MIFVKKITRRAEVFFSLKSNTNAKKFSGQAFKRGFSVWGPASIGDKVRRKLRFFKFMIKLSGGAYNLKVS